MGSKGIIQLPIKHILSYTLLRTLASMAEIDCRNDRYALKYYQPLRPVLQLLLHRPRRHPRSSKALHAPVQSLIVIASSYCTGLFINFA